MNTPTPRILILLFALVAVGLILSAPDASAQCAMCKASAANLDSVSARTLNLATLILLCPPVAIFCAIFVIAYKHRNSPGDGDKS
jgi:heme/copper-type cytochrome/quinol oxidase subunit 2